MKRRSSIAFETADAFNCVIKDCHWVNPTHDPIIARLSHWVWWDRIGRPSGPVHPASFGPTVADLTAAWRGWNTYLWRPSAAPTSPT